MLSRTTILDTLKRDCFDLLIIGGGATGAGIALDAALRGFRVALVEAKDFSSGTSSRSTKLIHGGVRYLELAIKKGDWRQWHLVSESLRERATLLQIAPHLVRKLPIVIPVHSLTERLYYGWGMKLYDALSRRHLIESSKFISKTEVLDACPQIRSLTLQGGIEYFDAQFDDARMNIALVLTGAENGAYPANYVRVEGLKKEKEKWRASAIDVLSGERFEICAQHCVNAAGPWGDAIRRLDDPQTFSYIKGSRGTHLILPSKYAPLKGLLLPKTTDQRVLFMLPWQRMTLVGTTECPSTIVDDPVPTKEEILFLLGQLEKQLGICVDDSEISCAWAGIRPLLHQLGKSSAFTTRDFKILRSASGLYSVLGGKWTTYRRMAEEFVDQLCKETLGKLIPCRTADFPLIGGNNYRAGLTQDLQQTFGWNEATCRHLVDAYGDRAMRVATHCKAAGGGHLLLQGYPYLQGEIRYAMREEMAQTPEDVLYRRLRLGFLDQKQVDQLLAFCSSIFSKGTRGA